MAVPRFWSEFRRFAAREALDPAVTRALRATLAFMIPLILAAFGRVPTGPAVLASFAAHAVAGLDIRGAYALRISLIGAMTLVFTAAAWLGAAAEPSLLLAVLATALIGLGAGLWRHLLGEYGFSVAASSALLFFIALAATAPGASAEPAALATLLGCVGATALHAASWPFRAQHPLRRTVAASWIAVADLCAALPPSDPLGAARRRERVADCEHALRTTLDQAFEALAAAQTRKSRPFVRGLEELNHAAAQLASQVMGLNPILEGLQDRPGGPALAAAVAAVLASLVNTTRSVALAVVSHQPAHLHRFDVRLRRLTHLVRVLQGRAAAQWGDSPAGCHLAEVLRQLQANLPAAHTALAASLERAQERGPLSYEILDLETWTLRPLASALNFSLRVDPALVRFSLRLTVIMMAGTAAWRGWNLPHGYWIPLCVMVVLQPDFGATKERATQRVLGTLAGSFLASLILWLHPPYALLMAASALTCFAFTFELKRDYTAAVFYITLLMVLQMEASGPVTMALTVQRLAFTLGGCVLALLAALTFWPVWERDRFPPLMTGALRANADFLALLGPRLGQGGQGGPWPLIQAKRKAERANSQVFSSINRMAGDPKVHQEGLDRAAALANGNLRITRWLSVAALHANAQVPPLPTLEPLAAAAAQALEAMAGEVAGAEPDGLGPVRAALEQATQPTLPEPRAAWIQLQLEQAATELSAMLLE